jgi:hypothetical protein
MPDPRGIRNQHQEGIDWSPEHLLVVQEEPSTKSE